MSICDQWNGPANLDWFALGISLKQLTSMLMILYMCTTYSWYPSPVAKLHVSESPSRCTRSASPLVRAWLGAMHYRFARLDLDSEFHRLLLLQAQTDLDPQYIGPINAMGLGELSISNFQLGADMWEGIRRTPNFRIRFPRIRDQTLQIG